MTGVIKEIIREMAETVKNPTQSKEEFQKLAKQTKQALKEMITNGQYQEALSVVTQLSVLLPDDLELLRLRQNIFQQVAR